MVITTEKDRVLTRGIKKIILFTIQGKERHSDLPSDASSDI